MKDLDMSIITKLNKTINNWLHKQGFELDVSLDTDFAYYYAADHITYALAVSDRFQKTYINFCKTLEPDIKADIFILSLMHEIGHSATWDDVEDAAFEECKAKKHSISMLMEDATEEEADMLAVKYYNLIDELAATLWGLFYIKDHQNEVNELWTAIRPLIMKFYRDNNVEL